jgi:hypothetical protein
LSNSRAEPENQHLPDIPSEADVKERGISVGEMESKLLAKIEELTLHMIEADQRIEKLARNAAETEQENVRLREKLALIEAYVPHQQ